jgi:hypothetical protein
VQRADAIARGASALLRYHRHVLEPPESLQQKESGFSNRRRSGRVSWAAVQWTMGQSDKETMGQWTLGQRNTRQWTIEHWDNGNGRTGQGDDAQWDNGIVGNWDGGTKEQWDNGTLDNGTVDKKRTMDTWTMSQWTIRQWDNRTLGQSELG